MAASQRYPQHPSLLYLSLSFDSIHVQNMRPLLPGDNSRSPGLRMFSCRRERSERACRSVCRLGSVSRWGRQSRLVLMFHAPSGTDLWVTCHSPTGSQLKWLERMVLGWLLLTQTSPERLSSWQRSHVYRLVSCYIFDHRAEADLGFRSRRFALISCRVLCYPLRQTAVFRK